MLDFVLFYNFFILYINNFFASLQLNFPLLKYLSHLGKITCDRDAIEALSSTLNYAKFLCRRTICVEKSFVI
jgi:hypothetical protein